MDFLPVPDFGLGALVQIIGFGAPILLSPLVVLGEALLLRYLLPRGRAFWCSFYMNLITTFLGYLAVTYGWPASIAYHLTNRLTGAEYYDLYYGEPLSALVMYLSIWWVIAWAVSVLVEGVVLMVLEHQYPTHWLWLAAVVVNTASYVAMPILAPVAFILWGSIF